MAFQLPITIPPLPKQIRYGQQILLCGSCFTEHIAGRLAQHKFDMLANPHGTLFNPFSVASSLCRYVSAQPYTDEDLFLLDEVWHSWDHHTCFSDTDKTVALTKINTALQEAAAFIRTASFILLTPGSAFQYILKDSGRIVANNHRAPAQWFEKRLSDIPAITEALGNSMQQIRSVNPEVTFILTVSPVRHIRDGITENNRSKARLIEAIHVLCHSLSDTWYFPAYELVLDVLRDYRFFDIDMVHPNFAATSYVWECFTETCIAPDAAAIMPQIKEITLARHHRPRFPDTVAHRDFLKKYHEKTVQLQQRYAFLSFEEEQAYFSDQLS